MVRTLWLFKKLQLSYVNRHLLDRLVLQARNHNLVKLSDGLDEVMKDMKDKDGLKYAMFGSDEAARGIVVATELSLLTLETYPELLCIDGTHSLSK